MEHVKGKIQQGAGNAYFAGMQWRGITLGHADAAALNQFDIDISKAQAPEARTWLLQNKAEFIGMPPRYPVLSGRGGKGELTNLTSFVFSHFTPHYVKP
ncbi:TPA: hypothetical protein NO898_004658 [Klebsiella quasipneumoniae subsp. similipneumoniae]|nr:hypothetical protein [Klebsiella quasipneumoniae subsp. similipneumoniae]